MSSDDPRPVARAIFSRRETILLAAAAMTTATLRVLLSRLTLDEVSSPRFQREYVFVRNAPYDRMDRALFLRRDFWEAHPRRHALDCVPVAETALAAFTSRGP
jgi:hypothetical protein